MKTWWTIENFATINGYLAKQNTGEVIGEIDVWEYVAIRDQGLQLLSFESGGHGWRHGFLVLIMLKDAQFMMFMPQLFRLYV